MLSAQWVKMRLSSDVLAPSVFLLLVATVPVRAQYHAVVPVAGTSPTTGFTATLEVTGTASVSGSGTARLPLGISQGFSIPQQSANITLAGGTVNVIRNPSGSVDFNFDTAFQPGLNTQNTATQINSATIDLLNGAAVPLALNPVTVGINTTILGIIPLSLDLNVNFSGALSSLVFQSNAAAPVVGNIFALPGDFTIGGNVQATGSVDLGILGSLNLGQVINQTINTSAPAPAPLPGITTLTDLNPGTPLPHNLLAQFNYPNLGFAIPVAIQKSGTVSQDFPAPGFFSSGLTHIDVNWSVDLTARLTNLSYNLSGQANAAIVPEASSVLLLGATGLAAIPVLIRRRRMAQRG